MNAAADHLRQLFFIRFDCNVSCCSDRRKSLHDFAHQLDALHPSISHRQFLPRPHLHLTGNRHFLPFRKVLAAGVALVLLVNLSIFTDNITLCVIASADDTYRHGNSREWSAF